MLLKWILEIVSFLPRVILGWLPNFSFEIPDGMFEGIQYLTYGLGYILPMKGLLPILIISLGVTTFQITVAIIVRIKSFIPTMGS